MKRAIIAWMGAIFALIFSANAVQAESEQAARQQYDVRQFTCPVGGNVFKQEVGYSAYPLLTMPDGSWLGDTGIGVQIPVCPDNGLVLLPDLALIEASGDSKLLYTNYSAQERTRLQALIAHPDYMALKQDGYYAQAWWLATQLERPAEDRFFMLQRSTWATSDPVLRKRLVARFAEEAPAIIDKMKADQERTIFLRMYIVNALRELGRFDEALALLNQMTAGGKSVPGQVDPNSMFDPEDPTGAMRLAIAQKDDGRFAAELLPPRMVSNICNNELAILYGPTSAATLAACKIRKDREQRQSDDLEAAFEMRADRVALDRTCADTPDARRSEALKQACAMRVDDGDRLAAKALVKDGPKLAADCNASDPDARKGAFRYACIDYQLSLSSALGAQLAKDAAAYSIFCPSNADDAMADRAEYVEEACSDAREHLDAITVAKLVENPSELDRRCADKEKEGEGDIDGFEVLLEACSKLESAREAAATERLSTNGAAFDADCGRFSKTNASGNGVYELTEAQRLCRNAWRLRENTRVHEEAKAKGLWCLGAPGFGPSPPTCLTKAEYDKEMTPSPIPVEDALDISFLEEGSSLMKEAHNQAAAIIAKAKIDRKYPTK